ncbi:MAG TPA: thiamine pyrophosphate-dependent enzyme, partial [Trebonia sp.]|nr:thiamine pyrophosphate-dependent enzyme [Trebonia sp.]
IARHLMASVPGRYRYVQGGLGQGLGLTLGAKLAMKGDIEEVVIFNNGSYASMKNNHLRSYPEGAAARSGHFRGVDLSAQPDAAAVASAAGAAGITVRATEQLAPALDKAITTVRGGPTAAANVLLTL